MEDICGSLPLELTAGFHESGHEFEAIEITREWQSWSGLKSTWVPWSQFSLCKVSLCLDPRSNPGKRSRRTHGQQYFPEKKWVPLNGAVVGWCLLTRFCPNTLQIFRALHWSSFPRQHCNCTVGWCTFSALHHQNTTQEYRNSWKVVQIENGFSKICRTQVRKQCQTPLQVDYALCRWTMH